MHRILQIMPTYYPVTAETMNYSWVITVAVMLLAGLWYLVSARHYYDGPRTNIDTKESDKETEASFAGSPHEEDRKSAL